MKKGTFAFKWSNKSPEIPQELLNNYYKYRDEFNVLSARYWKFSNQQDICTDAETRERLQALCCQIYDMSSLAFKKQTEAFLLCMNYK